MFGRWFAVALGAGLFAAAAFILWREFRGLGWDEVKASLAAVSPVRVAAALVLTAGSYFVFTLYEWLAIRHLGLPVPYRRAALAAFAAYAFNLNIGVSVLGGAAVRLRLYPAWGVRALDIAQIVAFTAGTFLLGVVLMGGIVLLFGEAPAEFSRRFPVGWLRPLGGAALAAVVGYVALCALWRRPLRVRGSELRLPGVRMALVQSPVAALDLAVAGSVLYALHGAADVSFLVFLGVYLFALVAGMISHVPGGLGVFESAVLLGLPTGEGGAGLVATLLLFRAIYYVLPLLAAALVLGIHGVLARRRAGGR